MPFQLVIVDGKEAGREFLFSQATVTIGRVDECDVLLYEQGVSRKHARIVKEDATYFVEDLGSSNGTKLNGGRISERHALREGDVIGVGSIVFKFATIPDVSAEHPVYTPGDDDEDGKHTRIVKASEKKRSKNRGVVALPKDVNREELAQLSRRGTAMMPAIKPKPSGPRPSAPKFAAAPPEPLAPRAPQGGLSAAERARLSRQGPLGRATLFWRDASTATKRGLQALGALVVVGLLALGVSVLLEEEPVKKPPEPTSLGFDPITASFGVGPDVLFEHASELRFDFEPKSPAQILVVVHLQCRGLSKEEVSVAVNGVEVGWLPPDTLDASERSVELLVPAAAVKRNELNSIVFDNVKNPPERDAWRVWNLSLETVALPDGETLKPESVKQYERAVAKWDQRAIGASNLWDAYNGFRSAWLMLESLPGEERGPTYSMTRERLLLARQQLDMQCNRLLAAARTKYEYKKPDEARSELDHVKEFFPSRAGHPCPSRAELLREELDL